MKAMDLAAQESGRKSLIHSVREVHYAFLKRFPPVLVISADGWVQGEGSLEPELRAVPAQVPLRGGHLGLAFLSALAGEPDQETLHPIHADLEWKDSPETVHQITVHSRTNKVTKVIGQTYNEIISIPNANAKSK